MSTCLQSQDGTEEDDDDRVPGGKDAEGLDLVVVRVHVGHWVCDGPARRDPHGQVDGQTEYVRGWNARSCEHPSRD